MVRCILAYALRRGQGTDDCRKADFGKVYQASEKAGDATFCAAMLVGINAAMPGGEVAALQWDEVDLKAGELATRRPKTGVARVATLWPETVKALQGLKHDRDPIFYTTRRSYTVHAVGEKWARYRQLAGLCDRLHTRCRVPTSPLLFGRDTTTWQWQKGR